MSKITPKNLSYDSTLPPFLQRLQNAHANSHLDGRHEHVIARPKRARNVDEDDDDAPAYLDEATNETLSKEEYVALVTSGDGGVDVGEEETVAGAQEENEHEVDDDAHNGIIGKTGKLVVKERVAGIGATRKRKTGKVVGAADEERSERVELHPEEVAKADQETSQAKPKSSMSTATAATIARTTAKSKRKTAKKIKLSFGDDTDEG